MKNSKRMISTFLMLFFYSIAMAYAESAVVVYLRKIYYPDGFTLPLQPMPFQSMWVEIFREAATLVMLLSVAMLAGKNRIQRIGSFIFCFGIWDIFYYVWLKALLDWPAGWLEWDVLFLIPAVWLGPVLAPVLVSLGLIGTGILIFHSDLQGKPFSAGWTEWLLILTGCGIIFLSFIIQGDPESVDLSGMRYPWWMFVAGYAIALVGVVRMIFCVNMKRS